jgi:hypothetical protein
MKSAAGCLALIGLIGASPGLAQDFSVPTYGVVGPNGSIHMPDTNFRASWPTLGSWTILGDGEATGQHVVYTQPGVIEYYLEHGAFPDGAVLVKELLETETGNYTTGTAAYAAETTGWFVMVKDNHDRFEGNNLWGTGWGWAYFGADDRDLTTTENYRSECKSCHIPARKTDWIYIEAYPVLNGE